MDQLMISADPRPRWRRPQTPGCGRLRRLLAVALVVGCAVVPPADARTTAPAAGTSGHVPVYSYFYQWYDRGSWQRAKQDFPLAGRYSSDDPHVLRNQVRQAQAAGIDGFLTSWKSTPTLNRRLTLLLKIADDQNLDVGVVYEALNFYRQPLPLARVKADMIHLVSRWGSGLRSSYYGRPVIIWTGTDQYRPADVQAVRSALGNRAYLLAASKTVAGYERVANAVDGEAYYWSSANPRATATMRKLTAMSAAVHRHQGIWIAPAASGFDGNTLGHSRVIDRDGGRTLTHSLDNAFRSKPDGIGVISWNEWSENTYIEPGERYGSQEIVALRDFLRTHNGLAGLPAVSAPPAASGGSWSGMRAVLLLSLITALGLMYLSLRVGRHRPKHSPGLAEDPVLRLYNPSSDERFEAAPKDRNNGAHHGYVPTK